MKKLLSLLGSVLIAATSASVVVACGNSVYSGDKNNPDYRPLRINPKQELDDMKSLGKSFILSKEYGVNNQVIQNYISNQTKGSFNFNTSTESIDKAISGDYLKDYKIENGTIGLNGGVFLKGTDAILNSINDKVKNVVKGINDTKVEEAIGSILDGIFNTDFFTKLISDITGKNLTNWQSDLATSASTMLGAVSNVTVSTAVQGIFYALGLLPNNMPGKEVTVPLMNWLTEQIKTMAASQTKVDGFIDGLKTATTLEVTSLSGVRDKMAETVDQIMTDDQSDTMKFVKEILSFVSYASTYLGYFSLQKETPLEILKGQDIPDIADAVIEKDEKDNKYQFNIAGLFKGISYYLGNNSDEKIQQLFQIVLLENETSLSKIGQKVATALSNALKIPADQLSTTLVNILTNTKDKIADDLIPDVKQEDDKYEYFDQILNGDWKQFNNDVLKESLTQDANHTGDLFRVFLNDESGKQITDKPNLNALMNVPLYKILYLANVTGYNATDLQKNALLPNVDGKTTQGSITRLITIAKGIISPDETDIKSHSFSFNKLEEFINYILYSGEGLVDGKNMKLVKPILTTIVDSYNGKSENKQKDLTTMLGYLPALDNGKANSNKLFRDKSIMGKLVHLFINDVKPDKDGNLTLESTNKPDNLKFFFNIIQPILSDLLTPVDYSYWIKWMMYEDNGMWNAKNNIDDMPNTIHGETFGDTGLSKNIYKKITYKVWFDPSKMKYAVINALPLTDNASGWSYWTITAERDRPSDMLKFTSIIKNQDPSENKE